MNLYVHILNKTQFDFQSETLTNFQSLPSIKTIMKAPFLPNVYSTEDLAFFCKMEVKIENKTKFPIKVRLGDIDYVNWQEGKGFRKYQGY